MRSGPRKHEMCGKLIRDHENKLCFHHSKLTKQKVTSTKEKKPKVEKPKVVKKEVGEDGWVYEYHETPQDDLPEGENEVMKKEDVDIVPQNNQTWFGAKGDRTLFGAKGEEILKLNDLSFGEKYELEQILESAPSSEEKPEEKKKSPKKKVDSPLKNDKPIKKPFTTTQLIEMGFYVVCQSLESLAVENEIHIEGVTCEITKSDEIKSTLAEIAARYEVEEIEIEPEWKLLFLVSSITYTTWMQNRLLMQKAKNLNSSTLPNNGFKNPETSLV